nr:transcription initiation factor TFIID subunit 7-like [Tanacetum cinerariifolium]
MSILRGRKSVPGIIAVKKGKWKEKTTRSLYNGRRGTFTIGEDQFPASLFDLPCIVESHKTYDDSALIKTADVGQMIMVRNESDPALEVVEIKRAGWKSTLLLGATLKGIFKGMKISCARYKRKERSILSNNKSNWEKGSSGQKDNNYTIIVDGGDNGVAEKG